MTVYIQQWEESERGWGTRPMESSYHLSKQDLQDFIKDYWDSMPDEVPYIYYRPVGEPITLADEALSKQYMKILKESKNGVRFA
jgi:hypothetical protein